MEMWKNEYLTVECKIITIKGTRLLELPESALIDQGGVGCVPENTLVLVVYTKK